MRTLAIDLGMRRIGLAMSDEGGKYASPFEVLHVGIPDHAKPRILTLIQAEGVQRLVVGLPLNMDGTLGTRPGRRLRGDGGCRRRRIGRWFLWMSGCRRSRRSSS